MLECSEFPHAYDNPSSMNSPARTANRLPSYTHHRTSSNVSSTSTSSQSNVNPTFRLEDEADYSSLYSPGHSLVSLSSYFRPITSKNHCQTALPTAHFHTIRATIERTQWCRICRAVMAARAWGTTTMASNTWRARIRRTRIRIRSTDRATSRSSRGYGRASRGPTTPTARPTRAPVKITLVPVSDRKWSLAL